MRVEITARLIVLATAGTVFCGLMAFCVWAVTGNERLLRAFFDYPGAAFLVAAPLISFRFSLLASRNFAPGEPLRKGWQLITCAAACHVVGALGARIFAARSLLNPLLWVRLPEAATLANIQRAGLMIGGPIWMATLAVGLLLVWRAYGRAGVRAPLEYYHWAAVAVSGAFAAYELYLVALAVGTGKRITLFGALELMNDPLLCVLLLVGMLIRRSVFRMGRGLIARCWGSFVTGILLTSLGDLGIFAINYGYLPWPYAALSWYVWFPAEAAFALGPVYQAVAIRRAANATRLRFDAPPSEGVAGAWIHNVYRRLGTKP